MELPFIDQHGLQVSATPEQTWQALLGLLERPTGSAAFVRLLGCQDTQPGGPRPLALGSSLPGFHIAEFQPPARLALAGRHRFSRYLVTFQLQSVGEGRTLLRADTHAEFPGLFGRLYRLLVISSRIHVVVTRLVLRSIAKSAERRARS